MVGPELAHRSERLLGAAAGVPSDACALAAARPRLGAVSFLHRFGSALNHHVHLHVCATEGVFVPAADGAGCDASPAFLPARPINQADLAALTERVRRRMIRWFRMQRLLDAAAAADMLAWENSGFSVDASVRITLIDRDVPSYFQSLEQAPGGNPGTPGMKATPPSRSSMPRHSRCPAASAARPRAPMNTRCGTVTPTMNRPPCGSVSSHTKRSRQSCGR
jgi:hypothetical protein